MFIIIHLAILAVVLVQVSSRIETSLLASESSVRYAENVTCSVYESSTSYSQYDVEAMRLRGCLTSSCQRVIEDGIFTDEEIGQLLAIAEKGMSMRNSKGGPTLLDINTGYLRDTEGRKNLQKFTTYFRYIHEYVTGILS